MIKKLRLLITVLVCGFVTIQLASIRYRSSNASQLRRSYRAPAKSTATGYKATPETTAKTRELTSNSLCRQKKDKLLLIDAAGNFSQRIQALNNAIDCVRLSVFSSASFAIHANQSVNSANTVLINDDDYNNVLTSKYEQITTVMLPWHNASTQREELLANVKIQDYYPWTGTTKLCKWLHRNQRFTYLYVGTYRHLKCNDNMDFVLNMSVPKYVFFKENRGKKATSHFYRSPPISVATFHIFAGWNMVTGAGQFVSGTDRFILDYCYRHHRVLNLSAQVVESAPYMDEVFAIQHPAGYELYHSMVEEIPRIAPFVEFLRRQPQIRIHLTGAHRQRSSDFLHVLGINSARAIWGPVRARIVYMPRPATCMTPRLVETQILSRYCQDFAQSNFGGRPRNRLILILRSSKRRFYEPERVIGTVRAAAADYGLQFTKFSDIPTPSFNSTMTTFYEAVMVVGVHGAGLSNLLFSQPRTFVIEIVPNCFATSFCYLHLAHGLGHHWYGIAADGHGWGVSRVNIDALNYAVRANLDLWLQQNRNNHETMNSDS